MQKTTIALLASLLLAGAAHAATDWRAMAAADLDAVRAAIRSGHPGYIDEQNPGFRAWEQKGYDAARALLPRVRDYDSALAAVRYYVAGFQDGHLVYSDDIRKDDPIVGAGWKPAYVDGAYRVVSLAPRWRTPLPPLGATLLSCDGLAPDALLRQRIGPYYDGRDLPSVRHDLASALTKLTVPGDELRECRFRKADGKTLALRQHYAPIPVDDYFAMPSGGQRVRGGNGYSLQDGVLWVRAANFQPDREAAQQIERMLQELPKLAGVHTIVFDSRGNGGGNSSIGDAIFRAATGGLDYDQSQLDQLPRTYAQWRVSPQAVQAMEAYIGRAAEAHGPDSAQAKAVTAFREQLREALQKDEQWIEQKGGPRITRADIAARGGKLRGFSGKLALVTDENCASACLDFADQVLQVPGAVHLGLATSADTLYMEGGMLRMPSGNHLVMPLKVWRNRLRGNNEPLRPEVPLQVNMADDAAVRRAVLAALAPQ